MAKNYYVSFLILIRFNCSLFFGLKLYILKNFIIFNCNEFIDSKAHLIEKKKNWLNNSWVNERKKIISFSLKKSRVVLVSAFSVPPSCSEHQISEVGKCLQIGLQIGTRLWVDRVKPLNFVNILFMFVIRRILCRKPSKSSDLNLNLKQTCID